VTDDDMSPPIATATSEFARGSTAADRDDGGGVVTLEVPAHSRYLRVVRLVASACAADAGFDIDDVEDVRVAADELCAGALELAPLGTIVLTFETADGELTMHGTAALAAQGQEAAHETEAVDLRAAILGVVADSHSFSVSRRPGDAQVTISFTKRRAEAA
jgi:anti-sigma regulatory factor (Ser/Thr protein kinase)